MSEQLVGQEHLKPGVLDLSVWRNQKVVAVANQKVAEFV